MLHTSISTDGEMVMSSVQFLSIFTSLTVLMSPLSTSPPYSPTSTFHFSPSSPVCVIQLILWVRLAMECGQPTRVHIIKENQFFLSQQLWNAETSTYSGIPWLFPSPQCWDFVCHELCRPSLGVTVSLFFAWNTVNLKWSMKSGSYNNPPFVKNVWALAEGSMFVSLR